MKNISTVIFILLIAVTIGGCSDKKAETKTKASQAQPQTTETSKPDRTPVIVPKIIKKFEHQSQSFTQGFFFYKGKIYEGTGLKGSSKLNILDAETGKKLNSVRIPDEFFGEGIALVGNEIYQLTWQEGICLVWNFESLKKVKQFKYNGEGWGLTYDSKQLIMSDGTNMLRFVDPKDFSVISTLPVFDGNQPVGYINELEWINGEIWANIWMADKIARIDPSTGKVKSWLDLSSFRKEFSPRFDTDVLNGIAYDAETGRIWVTGKKWPLIFEIKVD
jgi:glutamine cyclotransferase